MSSGPIAIYFGGFLISSTPIRPLGWLGAWAVEACCQTFRTASGVMLAKWMYTWV